MTKSEFVSFVKSYWANTPDVVVEEIGRHVARAPSSAIAAIKTYLERRVDPHRRIGVSQIIEAAEATGSALSPRERHEFDVTCDCCQAKWSYAQGQRDRCPYCGFPWDETARLREYERSGAVPPGMREGYQRLLKQHERYIPGGDYETA